jgi:hypothetical protein
MTEHSLRQIQLLLDVQNESLRDSLASLFRSVALSPKNVFDANGEFLFPLAALSQPHIYITDHIAPQTNRVFLEHHENFNHILLANSSLCAEISQHPSPVPFNIIVPLEAKQSPNQILLSILRRVREQSYYGLNKCMTYGTETQKYVLSHSNQREWFRNALQGDIKKLSNARNRAMHSLSKNALDVLEELLIFAIWDAYPELASADKQIPVVVDPERTVHVEWAFDGTSFGLGIQVHKCPKESLDTENYLRFLFADDRQARMKELLKNPTSDAGLILVLNRLTSLVITSDPNGTTEIIALLCPHHGSSPSRSDYCNFQHFSISSASV